MKLLQINVTANWGSTGRIAEEIGQAAMMCGWDSHIAYGRYMNSSSSQLYRIGDNIDTYYHAIYTRLFDKHGYASKKATIDLVKYIDNLKPDIIHLHNIHGYYLNYSLLFNYLANKDIPIVWTLHDCWPFTGHCAHFDFIKCEKWKTACYECPQKRAYPASLFLDHSKENHTDKKHWFTSVRQMTIVPVSNWLAKKVKESFLGKYTIKVIHNGIDTNLFRPIAADRKQLAIDGKFVILGVASLWSTHKGLADFIKLRHLLSDEYAIVLIGLNARQIKSLPHGIIGIRRTNSIQELAEYYSFADVFVNPTWEDNFPTVNIEALSCGTPVITYRTGGSIEAINKHTGFIVEQGDVQSIADIAAHLKTIGKQSYNSLCRDRALTCFDKQKCYDKYITLYKELLSK